MKAIMTKRNKIFTIESESIIRESIEKHILEHPFPHYTYTDAVKGEWIVTLDGKNSYVIPYVVEEYSCGERLFKNETTITRSYRIIDIPDYKDEDYKKIW